MGAGGDELQRRVAGRRVVLFDGVCGLCDATVRFVVGRDPEGVFVFASLQSEAARGLLAPLRVVPQAEPDTVLLIEDGRLFTHSTAAVRIARRLAWPWRVAWALVLVPRPVRDAVYRWIARNRYRWFGRKDACTRPSRVLAERFLD
jgi:predicted DCC family thiol-disulfide oxidoreductase YuxK